MNTLAFPRHLAVCLFLGQSTAHAGEGYSIELKVVPVGGEPQVSTVSGVNLDWHDSVTLPILIPHAQDMATVELDFDISSMTVGVTIEDLPLASKTEPGKPLKREYFSGALFFKWGEETSTG